MYGHAPWTRPFFVGAHDRGGRVAHRLCLDFPKSIKKVCLMDIAPMLTMYRQTTQEFATKYMGWFFPIQAAPLPEHLIGLDPQYHLEYNLSVLNKTPEPSRLKALREYRRCFCCTSTIRARCQDFASAHIGLEMDEADDRAGNKIVAPVLAPWGAKGTVRPAWDALATRRAKATSTVTGLAVSTAAISCRKNVPRKPSRNCSTSSLQCKVARCRQRHRNCIIGTEAGVLSQPPRKKQI